MGMSPSEVDRLSIWQLMAAADGYADAHSPDGGAGLSEAEKDDLWALVQMH
jgi:hypothetical protein